MFELIWEFHRKWRCQRRSQNSNSPGWPPIVRQIWQQNAVRSNEITRRKWNHGWFCRNPLLEWKIVQRNKQLTLTLCLCLNDYWNLSQLQFFIFASNELHRLNSLILWEGSSYFNAFTIATRSQFKVVHKLYVWRGRRWAQRVQWKEANFPWYSKR